MLNIILFLNAMSCLIFGSIFVLRPEAIGAFLGATPPEVIMAAGFVLLIFSTHLLSAILRKEKIKGEIYYFSFGDLLWVIASLAIIVATNWITSTEGLSATAAISFMVGSFAILQFKLAQNLGPNKIIVEKPYDGTVNTSALMDFGAISNYHPGVAKSKIINDSTAQGVGSERQCELTDGSTVEEKVIEWKEGVGYKVTIEGMNMPILHLENDIEFKNNIAKMTAEYRARGFFGEIILGYLMRPLMRMRLNKVISGFVDGFSK